VMVVVGVREGRSEVVLKRLEVCGPFGGKSFCSRFGFELALIHSPVTVDINACVI
jgi:hypothetical protein